MLPGDEHTCRHLKVAVRQLPHVAHVSFDFHAHAGLVLADIFLDILVVMHGVCLVLHCFHLPGKKKLKKTKSKQ